MIDPNPDKKDPTMSDGIDVHTSQFCDGGAKEVEAFNDSNDTKQHKSSMPPEGKKGGKDRS